MKIFLNNFSLLFLTSTKTYWRQRFILLIFLTFPFISSAQNIKWDKTIGGSLKETLRITLPTSDGGFILGGSSNTRKNGDKSQINRGPANTFDIWLVKLNANGSIAWDRTLGGNDHESPLSLLQTKDGGYLVLGFSGSGISGDKTQEGERWLVKLNPDGTIAWDKAYPDGLWKILQQTSDGGYILSGRTLIAPTYQDEEVWLVKLNASGTQEWKKNIFERTHKMDSFGNTSWLQPTPGGGYLIGGYNEPNNGRKFPREYWLVKLDANLTKIWDKPIKLEKAGFLSYLQLTQDGGYVLGGSSGEGTYEYKNEAGQGGNDYWIIKFGANGNQEWNKTLGGSGNDDLNSIYQTKDGGYLVGGNSSSNGSGDRTQNSQGAFDYWITKLNDKGQKTWDLTLGGNSPDYLTSVLQSQDGGYFVSGYSISGKSGNKTEASKGGYDYWVVKLDNTERQKQTITFEPVPAINFGTQKTISLKATASSGLPVSFQIISGPATVKGNKLILTGGSGTVTVDAVQPGNENYLPASNVAIRFVVNVPPITRLWDKTYGGIRTEYPNQGGECDKIFGSSSLAAMVVTPDGGYLLGGTSDSKKGNDKSADHRGTISPEQCFTDQQPIADYWIVKTDANGNRLWDKTYGGNDREELSTLIATPDGGYLLGGSSRSDGNGTKSEANRGKFGTDYWIVKTDANGNKLWDKTFGGDNWDDLTSLVATPDGGYLLGGSANSGKTGDKTQGGEGASEYWVIKIDVNGNKIWDKAFDRPGYDWSYLQTMLATTTGGYLLGGFSDTGNAPDYWVVEIDASGKKIWDKKFGGTGYDYLTSLAITPDGGYLLGGHSNSDKSGDKTEPKKDNTESGGYSDYWIIKIDSKGNKLWDKTLGGKQGEILSSLVATPDGGYLLGGYSSSNISGDKSEMNRGNVNGGEDYWVVKIDQTGKKLWDRTLGGNFYDDQLSSLLVTPDGSYLLGGTSGSGISGDKSEPLKGVRDIWMVKIKEESAPEALAWDRRYGGSLDDILTDVIKTNDGGYLVGGYSKSGNSGDRSQNSQGGTDYWIVKTDKNGQKLWDKRYGGKEYDYLNRVIQTHDGGYLLAGSSFSGIGGDKSEESRGNWQYTFLRRDHWVVKVDSLGNKQWDKTLGGTREDELKKVIQLSTGEYVLGGSSASGISGDKSQASQGGRDYWLVKISSTGTKIWDKRYGGIEDETLASFTLTKEGGFLLAGTSFSGKSGDKNEAGRGKNDYWVVRIDKDGNKLWDKTFGGTSEDEAASVLRSNGDYFIISGTSSSPASGDKSQGSQLDSQGFETPDFWAIKIDGRGNKVWDKTLGTKENDNLVASTFNQDGGYVFAGSSYTFKKSQGSWDYWIVKVDANGNQEYDQVFGGSDREELRTVLQTSDGGLLLGGRSKSGVSGDKTQPSQGETDYWLVKLAPETLSMVAAREVTPTKEPVTLIPSLIAYPNPFHGQVTVKFSLPQRQTATVKILDSQGREVSTLFQGEVKAKQVYEVKWQATSNPAGLYFLQLQTPTLQQQHKLLLRK
ncbi:hypothetical protein AHMF7605_10700 [Adhaeribacter arboris]|uniref:Secretion system C-terminal sorting domain-containing protein n=1 Tax=Adhaeribacter arboris TaxID=2072846 RepID=A0A2T2YEN9_9BACT|nr:T9SS type A sorting domain-containing protein [Adhaeribacter arboris]PSR53953.1 hypothetical protein AHMF7605_10700 [Adhaeribacter arboris]